MIKTKRKSMNKDVKIYRILSILDDALDLAAEALDLMGEKCNIDTQTILSLNSRFEAIAIKAEDELVD
jgi:hypothetical protein